MNSPGPQISERALEMRHAFDRSFAAPVVTITVETADFIAIRLGEDSYAIAMEEIGGLHTDVAVTYCPSGFSEFVGLAAFRGVLTPVYDLAALCGYPAAAAVRWLLLAKGGAAAFVFATFETHFRLERSAIAARQEGMSGRHTAGVAARAGHALPIISLSSVLADLADRIGARPLPKGASDHVS
jgi:purine-binding chemotaxis protein CheW